MGYTGIGVWAKFFYGGGGGTEPSLPEKYFDSVQKTAMLTCKIALPDSPHPIIISKNAGFRALHLAGCNEFCFLSLTNTFFIFGCWFLPEKFSVCGKIIAFADSGEAPWIVRLMSMYIRPPNPSLLAR